MSTNYSFRKTIPYFSRIQSLLTMVPGVILSKYNDEQIIRNTIREDNNNDSNDNDDDNNIHNYYQYNYSDGLYLNNYPTMPDYNGNKTVDDTMAVEKNSADLSSSDLSTSSSLVSIC